MNQLAKLFKDDFVVSYTTIPLFAMVLSAYTQLSTEVPVWSLRPNAAGEIFAFTLALDASLLLTKSTVVNRINPLLAQNYEVWLVLLLLASVVMMIFSGRTQCRIRKASKTKRYPFVAVFVCWTFAVAFTAAHLYLLIGS